MKEVFFSLAFIFCCCMCKANKIDSLNTDEDVIRFIKPLLQEKFKVDQLDITFSSPGNVTCKNVSDHENLKKWSKRDFNNDGLTDLFLNIYQSAEMPMLLVIIAEKNNSYKIINLNQTRSNCEFGYTDKKTNTPIIILSRKEHLTQKKDTITTDTLQYLDLTGSFIELKKTHPQYNIENIEFSTDHCFGMCPVFSLTIDEKGTANYNAIDYDPQQGKFKAVLSTSTKDSLFELLNDIDFANLKDNYKVAWTDQQTAILKVTYNDGEIKTINDYGMKGSFSLETLYDMLLNLRGTQQWEKQ
jgi:hypothetical protein